MNKLAILSALGLALVSSKSIDPETLEEPTDGYVSIQGTYPCYEPSWDIDGAVTWTTAADTNSDDSIATLAMTAGTDYSWEATITFLEESYCSQNTQSNWEVSWTASGDSVEDQHIITYEAITVGGTDDEPTCTFSDTMDGSETDYISDTAMTTSWDQGKGADETDICGYSIYHGAVAGETSGGDPVTVADGSVSFLVKSNNAVVVSAVSFLVAASLLF